MIPKPGDGDCKANETTPVDRFALIPKPGDGDFGSLYGDAIDSLKLYIHYLRQKLEVDPQQPDYILTSRGVGYRFASR